MCFVAGTQVSLASGETKNIEDVEVGELVKAYNEITKQIVNRPVEEVLHHESKVSDLYTFHFDGKSVTSNDEHRFFLPNEDSYASASEIYFRWKLGYKAAFLNESNVKVPVEQIDVRTENVPLFNLHVRGQYDRDASVPEVFRTANHNYFAGGVLAHNVKNCGGFSACTTCKDAAFSCGSSNQICDLNRDVMLCDFKNLTAKNTFCSCVDAAVGAVEDCACSPPGPTCLGVPMPAASGGPLGCAGGPWNYACEPAQWECEATGWTWKLGVCSMVPCI
jgi:hypothetical protein